MKVYKNQKNKVAAIVCISMGLAAIIYAGNLSNANKNGCYYASDTEPYVNTNTQPPSSSDSQEDCCASSCATANPMGGEAALNCDDDCIAYTPPPKTGK